MLLYLIMGICVIGAIQVITVINYTICDRSDKFTYWIAAILQAGVQGWLVTSLIQLFQKGH